MKIVLKRLLSHLIVAGTIATSGTIAGLMIQTIRGEMQITNPELRYTCKFYNYDDTLLYVTRVEPTHDAIYQGNLPTRPDSTYYRYEFSGWDNDLTSIRSDMTYHALYEKKSNDYTVKFVNYDGEILYETLVTAGDSVHYPYENPTRPSDAQYGYAFTGWDEPTTHIIKDTTFVAQYKKVKQKYKVYYFNYDETLLYVDTVYYGATSTYKGDTFTGPTAEVGYSYEFKEWSDSTSSITEDKAVIAIFELVRNKYAVTFYNHDNTVLYVDHVFYGDSGVYRGQTPYHQPDEDYAYEFVGWDREFNNITEDTSVYALFRQTNPECDIVFKNYDDTILEKHHVKYGSEVVYAGEEPSKPETEKYVYEFVGWDRDTSEVTGSFDVYPVFEEHLKEYTVTFLNYDESELAKVDVPYGDDATKYYLEVPTRPDDDFYTYQFERWSDDVSFVVKDMTVVAIYEATPKEQNKGDSEDGKGGDQGDHGHPDPDPDDPPVGPPATKFDVLFKNYDGEELDAHKIIVPGRPCPYDHTKPIPTRPDDKRHTNYEFCSWDKDLSAVYSNITTYAQYVIKEDIFTKYIVTFRNGDGTLLYECVCEENELPTYPDGMIPKLKGYIFVGWDKPLTRCTSSYTVYATFSPANSGSGGFIPGDDEMEGDAGSVSGKFGGEPVDKSVGTMVTAYSSSVYLRERSFGDFKNNKWEDVRPYSNKSADFSPLNLTSDLVNQAGFKSYTADMHFDEYRSYTPSPMYNLSFPKSFSDDAYDPIAEKDFSFTYSPFEINEERYLKLKEYSYSDTANITYYEDYKDYVYNTYLTVNDEEREFFTEFANDNNLSVSNINEIINCKTFISEYAKYNLSAEDYPEDSNYGIYFLKEAREGICNNFATSLTLLYRALGLPARFTVGYYVKPASEGLSRDINEKFAHAWTEIFLDDIGWVYVDGTGGATNGDADGGSSGEEEEDPIPRNPYNPFGECLLDEPLLTIDVVPEQSTKVYDGTPMLVTAEVNGQFLNEGDYFEANVSDVKTDVGSYVTRCRPRIYNAEGKDVTKKYVGMVQMNFHSYSITKRTIEITTGSAEIDRGPSVSLSCTDFIINSGSFVSGDTLVVLSSTALTRPGTAENVFNEYYIKNENGVNVSNNYKVIIHNGNLRIR